MKKFVSALLAATFMFGLSTEDVDAKVRHKHHNYVWHKGKHYTAHQVHKKKQKSRKHKARKYRRHVQALPPVVVAHVFIGSQHVTVDVNGYRYGDWIVSTGGHGFHTPQGAFHATRIERVYFSRKYDNSPMPYSVFFYGGNAIHGTNHLRSLGHPASHGCVRLHPEHAAQLYALVAQYGMNRTRIVVSN